MNHVDITRALKIPDLRWPFPDELRWLATQAKKHKFIVEVGSYLGRSTVAMASNTQGTVVAIDDWYGPRDVELSDEERSKLQTSFLKNVEGLNNVIGFRTDHANHSKFDESIASPDMVFIDGDHNYEGVKRDIVYWKSRLTPGGLLCGHDRNESGVKRALDELLPGWCVSGETIWYVPIGVNTNNSKDMRMKLGTGIKPLVTTMIPFSRKVSPEWCISMASIIPPMNGTLHLTRTIRVERGQAREKLIENALETGSKYGFFLDDDVTCPPNILRALLYVFDNSPEDVMVVGGIYCTKTSPAMPLVYKTVGDGPFYKWKLGQVFPCELLATGMMMIKMEVFKHLDKPWFKDIEHDADEAKKYGIIPEDFKGDDFSISDDGFFCHKVRNAGFKILAHGGVLGMHWGDDDQAYIMPCDSYPIKTAIEHKWSEAARDEKEYLGRIMEVYKSVYGYSELEPADQDLSKLTGGT